MDKVKVLFEKANAVLTAYEPVSLMPMDDPQYDAAIGGPWKDFLEFINANFDPPVDEPEEVKTIFHDPEYTSPGLPLEDFSDNIQPLVALRFLLGKHQATLNTHGTAKESWDTFSQRYQDIILQA